MSEARVLLDRISAFRRRLEGQNPHILTPVAANADSGGTATLEQQVEVGAKQQALLERSLRQLHAAEASAPTMPAQLTARARRLVEEARGLVIALRQLADEPLLAIPGDPHVEIDALAHVYREAVAMTEAALRLIGGFPDTPSVQLRLCDGVDGILDGVRIRLGSLHQTLQQRRSDGEQIDELAGLLVALHDGPAPSFDAFTALGDRLLQEAGDVPFRILSAAPAATQEYVGAPSYPPPARFIACHALMTARIVAHLVRRDPEWRLEAIDPVVTALLQDVGMLSVPVEALSVAGPLPLDARRLVEQHPRIGAERVAMVLPAANRLLDGILSHHERLDGTGYPSGLRDQQIAALPRLLAVADVYAAMVAPRPHRAGLDPRTALTDTLLMAENGLLDRAVAEKMLQLSFYPVGTVVELSDGCVGIVVANHAATHDLSAPLKPVVAIVTTSTGDLLAHPRHVDLSQSAGPSIVRAVPDEQRRRLLGKRYPDWV